MDKKRPKAKKSSGRAKNRPKKKTPEPLRAGQTRVSVKDTNKNFKIFMDKIDKAVHIYQFLRFRHVHSPIFLRRTLSYLAPPRRPPPAPHLGDSMLGRAERRRTSVEVRIAVTNLRLPNLLDGELNLSISVVRGRVTAFSELHEFTRLYGRMLRIRLVDGKIAKDSEAVLHLSTECDRDCLTPSSIVFQLNIESETGGFFYSILPFFEPNGGTSFMCGDYCSVLVPAEQSVDDLFADPVHPLITFSVDRPGKEDPPSPTKRSTRTFRDCKIIFEFVFSPKHRQSFCTKLGCVCPFCLLDCRGLDLLMTHLRHSHDRLTFSLVGGNNTIVQIGHNDFFDGSYEGNPMRLHLYQVQGSFPLHPLRSPPSTKLLALKRCPRRLPSPVPQQLFYNAMSYQPLRQNESTLPPRVAEFSWVKELMTTLVDEFSDVSGGEKEMMKLWNSFLLDEPWCLGDVHVVPACHRFVERHSKDIIDRMLCHNFLLHLVNLHNFGLLEGADILLIWESLVLYINSD